MTREAVAGRRNILVGREREVADLRGALSSAAAGHGSVVLLIGEPGIGKTHLANELTQFADAAGAFVAWGRCWDGQGAPAFWPWVQVLRACVPAADLTAVDPSVAAAVAGLAQGPPDTPPTIGSDMVPRDTEPGRFRLFDSITRFLKYRAASAPLVLIFDDLHAADESSLHLLRFLARDVAGTRILVVGTYREAEVRTSASLSPLLGSVARESYCMHLQGFSYADVAQFIAHAAELTAAPALVGAVHRITDGNPLFVSEIIRLIERDRLRRGDVPRLPIPDELRATIRRRFEPLGIVAHTVLSVAAVSGRDFDARVVEQVITEDQRPAVLPAINDALALGILTKLPDRHGCYSFSHELVVNTLYYDLPLPERVRLHRATGEVLEQLDAGNIEPRVAEIAHHFFHAAHRRESTKAIDYAIRAGRAAFSQLAYEQAVRWYERALELMDAAGTTDTARCAHLVTLAGAYRRAGDFAKVATVCRRAIELARALGDAELLARSAVTFGHVAAETGIINHSLVGWLEEALAVLPKGDSPLHVAVLGRLGVALYFAGAEERRVQVSLTAVEMARRLADPPTLADALMTRHFALWTPDHATERLGIATEAMHIGNTNGDIDTILGIGSWRILDLLELGDVDTASMEIERYAQLADTLRQPRDQWLAGVLRAMRAQLAGHWNEGVRLAQHALELGQRSGGGNAGPFFLVQQFMHCRELGQLAEVEVAVRTCADQFPALPIWRCGLTLLYCELGRTDAAREQFEQLAANDFRSLPRDGNWLAAMSFLAEVATSLADQERAAILYSLLCPYAHLNVVIAIGAACTGSVAHYLGLLATTLGRWQTALEQFETALACHRRLRAPTLIVRTQYATARLLLAIPSEVTLSGARPPDGASAHTLLHEALVAARAGGLINLEGLLRAAMQGPTGENHGAIASLAHPDAVPTFHHEGEYWSITYGDRVVQLKDSRGLHYIAWLVRHPGREFLAAHLQGVGLPPTDLPSSVPLGDAGPILDPRAQTAYTHRVRSLEWELEEAQRCNDRGRFERVQEELDVLSDDLAAAAGLGGRARKAGSYAERARVNVTRAISATLRRIRTADESLARYLATRLKTGNFCVYHP